MPISPTDITLRLSTGASTGNGDSASTVPANSLGGTVSTTAMGTTLFADATAAESAGSEIHYRCFFVLNNHSTLTLNNAKIYVSSETAGGGGVAIAVDNLGPKAKGAAYPQAARVATQTEAPTSTGSFSTPTTTGAALSLGDIGPGQVKGVWVRRTLANTAPQIDSASFTVSGETSP